MADPDTFQTNQTGLIVKVPEAEPAVRTWREELDPSAKAGVPAHITVLFPFLNENLIDSSVQAALTDLFSSHAGFDLRFSRSARIPGVLYLAPEPDTQLKHLTEAVAARWPETPPYGGRFTEILPHLTVCQGQSTDVMSEIEADLESKVPFTAHIASVELMVYNGSQWREHSSFPLQEKERLPTTPQTVDPRPIF